jgi:hypothetical protein
MYHFLTAPLLLFYIVAHGRWSKSPPLQCFPTVWADFLALRSSFDILFFGVSHYPFNWHFELLWAAIHPWGGHIHVLPISRPAVVFLVLCVWLSLEIPIMKPQTNYTFFNTGPLIGRFCEGRREGGIYGVAAIVLLFVCKSALVFFERGKNLAWWMKKCRTNFRGWFVCADKN